MSETQRPTLAAFLLARIEEDEAGARRHAAAARRGLGDGEALVWWGRVADRVLAECHAKRRILGQVYDLDGGFDGYTEATRDAVTQLAAIYAGHPDYDPAWTPEQDYTRPHDSPGGQDEHPSTKPQHQAQPGDRPKPNPDPDGSPTDQRHRPR